MCTGVPLSSEFLRRKGKCCANGCKNCPYFPKHSGSKLLQDFVCLCPIPCSDKTIADNLCECVRENVEHQKIRQGEGLDRYQKKDS